MTIFELELHPPAVSCFHRRPSRRDTPWYRNMPILKPLPRTHREVSLLFWNSHTHAPIYLFAAAFQTTTTRSLAQRCLVFDLPPHAHVFKVRDFETPKTHPSSTRVYVFEAPPQHTHGPVVCRLQTASNTHSSSFLLAYSEPPRPHM